MRGSRDHYHLAASRTKVTQFGHTCNFCVFPRGFTGVVVKLFGNLPMKKSQNPLGNTRLELSKLLKVMQENCGF